MGIMITAKGSEISFDMGAAGFKSLRDNIALCIDPDFGKIYSDTYMIMFCPKQWEESLNRIIAKKNLNCYLALDFLFASDCEGEADYRACKEIFDLIKGVDFGNRNFRYGAIAHNDYEEFKTFLSDCIRYHRKMRWS